MKKVLQPLGQVLDSNQPQIVSSDQQYNTCSHLQTPYSIFPSMSSLRYLSIITFPKNVYITVMILSFQTKGLGKQCRPRSDCMLLEGQSDLGLHCLLFHLHLFDKIP